MAGLTDHTDNANIFESNPLASIPADFITYIRPMLLDDNATTGWAVFTEDGVQLAIFGSHEAAYFSARQSNLSPVNVH